MNCTTIVIIWFPFTANSVLDDRFYAKLNEMIPQFVLLALEEQPADTEFRYSNALFGESVEQLAGEYFIKRFMHLFNMFSPMYFLHVDLYARVFSVVTPAKDHAAVYEASLNEQGIGGYLIRFQEHPGEFTI